MRDKPANATLQYVSPSHKIVLGYEPKDIIGRSVFDFVHPDDLAEVVKTFRSGISTGLPRIATFRYRHNDGHYIWLESSGSPLRNKDSHVVLSSRDITKRIQAEELLRTLTENAPVGIYIVQDGKFKYVNPHFIQNLSYSENELLDNKPLDLVYHEDRE